VNVLILEQHRIDGLIKATRKVTDLAALQNEILKDEKFPRLFKQINIPSHYHNENKMQDVWTRFFNTFCNINSAEFMLMTKK